MKNPRLTGPTVSVSWLAENISNPQVIVLDASMKPVGATATSAPQTAPVRIPGARRFDFDQKICDQKSSLPHMMPAPEHFEKEVRALGINNESIIVVYDRVGIYSSPRAWWMLKAMGHDQVAVLDGGLPAWTRAGLAVEPETSMSATPGNFIAKPRPEMFCEISKVEDALKDPNYAVLDARSEGRFEGHEAEPRQGLRAGHMPGSKNVPFNQVQTQGHMRSAQELTNLFSSKVESGQKLVFSCGSGVTACILALAAEMAGYKNITVYDGSWCEWGLPSSRPVELGKTSS